MIAMGCDVAGKGAIVVFEASGSRALHSWEMDKSIWAVRFAPDMQKIAAGGYDMSLTLFSMKTYAKLQTIKYQPLAGPAFIWSLEWCKDGSRLAIACWNMYATAQIRPDMACTICKRCIVHRAAALVLTWCSHVWHATF